MEPCLEVPPFCPATEAEKEAIEAFNDEVIDRLFVLNAERAAEEARLGLWGKKKGKGGRKKGKKARKSKKQVELELEEDV